MKSMVLTGIRQLSIVEKPVPELQNDNEVLISMQSVGICGSDIHYYTHGKIGSQVVQYPFTVGHEGAGIVTKVGRNVTRVKPGDKVAIDPAMPCFHCEQCRAGRYHTCLNLKFLGCPGQAEGCLSEFITMPETSCFLLPENLTTDHGALSEPLSIGFYATRLAGLTKGAKVGILGSGPIGISVLLPALAAGVSRTYMTDKIDERLSVAAAMGAHWTGNPNTSDMVKDILAVEPGQLDFVFECCGQQEAADQAIHLLKPGGRLMMIGIPAFTHWRFEADLLRRKEIDIQHVRRQNESVKDTLDMIADGRLKPDRMQTHTLPFSKVKEGFEMVANYADGVMKAMIRF